VGDTENGCIRRIDRDGVVSTFARGLGHPHQIAFDRAGNLYVADRALGVLRVGPDGNPVKLSVVVNAPTGVSVYDRGPGPPMLFIADKDGIVWSTNGGPGIRIPYSADPPA